MAASIMLALLKRSNNYLNHILYLLSCNYRRVYN
jgi:hypothetical protein